MSVARYQNPDATIGVEIHANDRVTIAQRQDSSDVWGPPKQLHGTPVADLLRGLLQDATPDAWFAAGADAGASDKSHDAFDRLAHATVGLMYETGFPLSVLTRMMESKVREIAARSSDLAVEEGS